MTKENSTDILVSSSDNAIQSNQNSSWLGSFWRMIVPSSDSTPSTSLKRYVVNDNSETSELEITPTEAEELRNNQVVLQCYLSVKNDDLLSQNIKVKNNNLREYLKLAVTVFGEDAKNFSYAKQVMLGILIKGYYNNNLDKLIRSNSVIENFLSSYLGKVNIRDFINGRYSSTDNHETTPIVYVVPGVVIGSVVAKFINKYASIVKNYQTVPNDEIEDVEIRGIDDNRELTRLPDYKGLSVIIVGGLAGGAAGYIYGYIMNYFSKKNGKIDQEEINQGLRKIIPSSTTSSIPPEVISEIATEAASCLSTMNSEVENLMHKLYLSQDYRSTVYDIVGAICSRSDFSDTEKNLHIQEAITRLKVKQIMIENDMPVEDYELQSSCYHKFLVDGEDAVKSLKNNQSMDDSAVISTQRRINRRSVVDGRTNSSVTRFTERRAKKRSIPNEKEEREKANFSQFNAEVQQLKSINNNLITRGHLNNLEYLSQSIFQDLDPEVKKEQVDSAKYILLLTELQLPEGDRKYPRLREFANNISRLETLVRSRDNMHTLSIEESFSNEAEQISMEMILDMLSNPPERTKRDTGSENDHTFTISDIERVQKILQAKEQELDIILLNRRQKRNTAPTEVIDGLAPKTQNRIRDFFATNTPREVISQLSEGVLRSGVRQISSSVVLLANCGIKAGARLKVTQMKTALKSLRTPKNLGKAALKITTSLAIGLAITAVGNELASWNYDRESFSLVNKFNDFTRDLSRKIEEDLKLYALHKGYSDIKSMVSELSGGSYNEDERELLYSRLFEVIRNSYQKHLVAQMIKDSLEEGEGHHQKVFFNIISSILTLISLIPDPISQFIGLASSIPFSAFINPDLTIINNCLAGMHSRKDFGYLSFIFVVGTLLEVASAVINAKNYAEHQYDITRDSCTNAMDAAKNKLDEVFKKTQYDLINARYSLFNTYALNIYQKAPERANTNSLLELREGADSTIAQGGELQIISLEKQALLDEESEKFNKYLEKQQDYIEIEIKVKKLEDKINQLKNDILVARYLVPRFNEQFKLLYPQDSTVIESLSHLGECYQDVTPDDPSSCIGSGQRKLSYTIQRAQIGLENLPKLEKDLKFLYGLRIDIRNKIAVSFVETEEYRQISEKSKSIDKVSSIHVANFYKQVSKWQENLKSRFASLELNHSSIRAAFEYCYSGFEEILEEFKKLPIDAEERRKNQIILNSKFASYVQIFLLTTKDFNEESRLKNPHHTYTSPIFDFFKERGISPKNNEELAKNFLESSDDKGQKVSAQLDKSNEDFIKDVTNRIFNHWQYRSWFHSKYKENTFDHYTDCDARSDQVVALEKALSKINYGFRRYPPSNGGLIENRACQATRVLMLRKDFENYQGFRITHKRFDDLLFAQIASYSDLGFLKTIEITYYIREYSIFNRGVGGYYLRTNNLHGGIPLFSPNSTMSDVVKIKTQGLSSDTPENKIIRQSLLADRDIPSLVDKRMIHQYPGFFNSYHLLLSTIKKNTESNSSVSTRMFNDLDIETRIQLFNAKYNIEYKISNTNEFEDFKRKVKTTTPGGVVIPSVSDTEKYLEYYMKLYKSVDTIKKIRQSLLPISLPDDIAQVITPYNVFESQTKYLDECDDDLLKATVASFAYHAREIGVPVFNRDKSVNTNAVLCLLGNISQKAIDSMPILRSYDISIEIEPSLFSVEKLRDYLDRGLPRISTPDDFKYLVINRCASAISADDKTKSRQCIVSLEEMQKQAMYSNNIKLFNQIDLFIKQANTVLLMRDSNYKAPKSISFVNEYAHKVLIKKLEEAKTVEDKIITLKHLMQIHSQLINENNISPEILRALVNLQRSEIDTAAFLIVSGFNVASYDENKKLVIDFAAVKELKETVLYFKSFDLPSKESITIYERLGILVTSLKGSPSFYKRVADAVIQESYEVDLKYKDNNSDQNDSKNKNIFKQWERLVEKFFLNKDNTTTLTNEDINESQTVMVALARYLIERNQYDFTKDTNSKLLVTNLITASYVDGKKVESKDYVNYAKTRLPDRCYPDMEKLRYFVGKDIEAKAMLNLSSRRGIPKYLEPLVSKILLEAAIDSPVVAENIDLSLNSQSEKERATNYALLIDSLRGGLDIGLFEKYQTILLPYKSSNSLSRNKNIRDYPDGSKISTFNIGTLAIFLNDGLITREDIEVLSRRTYPSDLNVRHGHIFNAQDDTILNLQDNIILKINNLIQMYLGYQKLNPNVEKFEHRQSINSIKETLSRTEKESSNLQTSTSAINKITTELPNVILQKQDTIKIKQDTGVKTFHELIDIGEKYNTFVQYLKDLRLLDNEGFRTLTNICYTFVNNMNYAFDKLKDPRFSLSPQGIEYIQKLDNFFSKNVESIKKDYDELSKFVTSVDRVISHPMHLGVDHMGVMRSGVFNSKTTTHTNQTFQSLGLKTNFGATYDNNIMQSNIINNQFTTYFENVLPIDTKNFEYYMLQLLYPENFSSARARRVRGLYEDIELKIANSASSMELTGLFASLNYPEIRVVFKDEKKQIIDSQIIKAENVDDFVRSLKSRSKLEIKYIDVVSPLKSIKNIQISLYQDVNSFIDNLVKLKDGSPLRDLHNIRAYVMQVTKENFRGDVRRAFSKFYESNDKKQLIESELIQSAILNIKEIAKRNIKTTDKVNKYIAENNIQNNALQKAFFSSEQEIVNDLSFNEMKKTFAASVPSSAVESIVRAEFSKIDPDVDVSSILKIKPQNTGIDDKVFEGAVKDILFGIPTNTVTSADTLTEVRKVLYTNLISEINSLEIQNQDNYQLSKLYDYVKTIRNLMQGADIKTIDNLPKNQNKQPTPLLDLINSIDKSPPILSVLYDKSVDYKNIVLSTITREQFSNVKETYFKDLGIYTQISSQALNDAKIEVDKLLLKYGVRRQQFNDIMNSDIIDPSKHPENIKKLLEDLRISLQDISGSVMKKMKTNRNVVKIDNADLSLQAPFVILLKHLPKYVDIARYQIQEKQKTVDILYDILEPNYSSELDRLKDIFSNKLSYTTNPHNIIVPDIANVNDIKLFTRDISSPSELPFMYNANSPESLLMFHAKLLLDLQDTFLDKSGKRTEEMCFNIIKKNIPTISERTTSSVVKHLLKSFSEYKEFNNKAIILSSLLVNSLRYPNDQGIFKQIDGFDFVFASRYGGTDMLLDSKVIQCAKKLSPEFDLWHFVRSSFDKTVQNIILDNPDATVRMSLFLTRFQPMSLMPRPSTLQYTKYKSKYTTFQAILPTRTQISHRREVITLSKSFEDVTEKKLFESVLLTTAGTKTNPSQISIDANFHQNPNVDQVFFLDSKTPLTELDSGINKLINFVGKNPQSAGITFFIELHGTPGGKGLVDENNLLTMDFRGDFKDSRSLLSLIDKMVEYRIKNKLSTPFDIRIDFTSCSAGSCSPQIKQQTTISDNLPITAIEDSVVSRMKKAVDSYYRLNSDRLKLGGIKNIVIEGRYGVVSVNVVRKQIRAATTQVPHSQYLRFATPIDSQNQELQWTASRHSLDGKNALADTAMDVDNRMLITTADNDNASEPPKKKISLTAGVSGGVCPKI